jgi:hypothetical protein
MRTQWEDIISVAEQMLPPSNDDDEFVLLLMVEPFKLHCF